MSANEPGIVIARPSSASEDNEQLFDLRRRVGHQFADAAPPPIVEAPGLSNSRQNYLFKSVRPFVRAAFQDETCPPPDN